jgi:ABC-type transport system involved in multi-copper enzyme maturation permease subunit
VTVAAAERLPSAAGRPPRLPFRLARAELLKLRKRRGLMVTAGLLTLGATIVMYVAFELFHVSNSAKYGPAGGFDHFRRSVFILSQLGSIAGALIGASVGADDLGSGVFRDLVATGRSRAALYGARVPGGLSVLWPLVALAYTLSSIFTVALAGGSSTPSVRLFVESGLWLELTVGLAFVLGLGVGSLVGSRAPTIAILFAWILILEPILIHVTALGVGRDPMLLAATGRLAPTGIMRGEMRVPMSLGVAIGVVCAWAVTSLAVGLRRTQTRDA